VARASSDGAFVDPHACYNRPCPRRSPLPSRAQEVTTQGTPPAPVYDREEERPDIRGGSVGLRSSSGVRSIGYSNPRSIPTATALRRRSRVDDFHGRLADPIKRVPLASEECDCTLKPGK
jgi:hypothetical protein